MKNKKIIIGIVVIGVLAFMIIIGVATYNGLNYAGNYQKSIYEDDSKIISESDSYSYVHRTSTTSGERLKSKFRLTGMNTIYDIYADEDTTININYNVNITDGKFKIVLIAPDDEVITILEESGEGTKEINIKSGESRVKIVGRDAKCDINISIDAKENVDIKLRNE